MFYVRTEEQSVLLSDIPRVGCLAGEMQPTGASQQTSILVKEFYFIHLSLKGLIHSISVA